MVFQSSQISGMVGGQMAMFANQHAFSQQVGVMAGTAPQMPMGGMQNPYPSSPSYAESGIVASLASGSGNLGAKIAGGMGMALPGMATGAALAGGLMGGSAGWLDPFTGVSRAFASGVGAGGMGVTGTLGHIGSAFSTGGLRAGGAMMAGGMGAAAAAAVPYYVAGKAIETVGANIYQGAQNIAEVGGMAGQYFGSQHGSASARPGGQMGRENIRGIVSAMHELVGEDTMRTMESLKGVMDKAGRMGMLTGVTDAQDFKQRFGKIVNQVQEVAKIMGTSLEEAMPALGQMRQMGLWRTSDILGTTMAAQAAGPAAGQMLQTMGAGARMSHAMGGTMRAGAMMGQASFSTMQAAVRAGTLTGEEVMEFTGGLGGAEGQAAMAQRLTGITSRFSQTSAGRLMMAGLGETEGGKFTGRIDEDKLSRFQSGEFNVQDLQGMGMKATRGKEGAMSFFRQAGRMGQNLGSQGGIEAMTQIVQQIADTKFGGSEEARHQLLQQMLGVGNREAELLGKLADDLPRIQDEETRRMDAVMRDTFGRLDRRQNASYQAFKDSLSHAWGEAVRPLQEIGERVATDFGEGLDSAADSLLGRVRRVPMGSQERIRLLRGGALGATASGIGAGDVGQSWLRGSVGRNVISNIREGGMGTIARAAAGMSGLGLIQQGAENAFGVDLGPSLGVNALIEGGHRSRALLAAGVRTGGGTLDLGGGLTTSRTDIEEARSRALRRSQGATMKRLKGKETPEKRDAMSVVKAELRKLIADPEKSKKLRELKEKDPVKYASEVTKMLRGTKSGRDAMATLREGGGELDDLDTLAIAQEEEGFGGGAHAADFAEISKALGVGYGDMDEVLEAQNEAVEGMVEAATGGDYSKLAGGLVASLNPIFGAMDTFTGGGFGESIGAALGLGPGVSESDIKSVMTGANAELMQKYLSGGISQEEMASEVERLEGGKGGKALGRLFRTLNADPAKKEAFKEQAAKFVGTRKAEVGIEARGRIREIASRSPTEVSGLGAESGSRFRSLVERYRGMGDGDEGIIREDLETLAGGITSKERRALVQGGGAFGKQVAGLSMILGGESGEGLGVMDEAQTQTFLKDLQKASGLDVKRLGDPALKELLEGGVKKGEVSRVRDLMAELSKTMVTETKKGMQSHNQRMAELMKEATSANTRFVMAVGEYIGKDNLTEAASKVVEAGRKASNLD